MIVWEDSPVERFAKLYKPDDFTPEVYVMGAILTLQRLGWFGYISPAGVAVVREVIDDMYGDGLDEDNYPFGVLWGMAAVGALKEVPGLVEQLLDWYEVCVLHQEYDLSYLPTLRMVP